MASIRSIIDHAVLPPKTPGAKEDDYDAISSEFLKRLLNACEKLKHLAAPPLADALRSLSESLQACRALNRGQLDKEALLKQFSLLKPDVTLVCHVVEQNAAILIRREIDQNKQDFVVFESFEVSPMTEHVLAADNALTWDFPGRAVRLSLAEFNNKSFQQNLAAFLEQASMEEVHLVQAQAKKAKVLVTEVRDTTDPALISQMLLSLLEAIGEYAPVPKLRKRVRDDVNFATNALFPWRRLPFWLVLRVATQRHLHLALGKSGRACYKLLMCIFFSELLDDASAQLPFFAGLERLEPDLVITLRAKLCRRMVKLEKDKVDVSPTYKQSFDAAFCSTVPHIEESIRHAGDSVNKVWDGFKLKTMRRVLRLQLRASDDSVRLSLTNCQSHLDQLFASYYAPSSNHGNASLALPDPLDKPIQEKLAFTSKVSALVQTELSIERDTQRRPLTLQRAKARCQELAGSIHNYLDQVGDLYNGDPAQQSVKVLSIFELWMRMDECAIVCCPLLANYRPIFDPGLLDVLQLPTLAGMRRLQAVQAYLLQRRETAKHPHFLHYRTGESFAAEYARQDAAMRQLMVNIQDASDVDRAIKEAAWEEETRQYKEYTEKISSLECLCTFDGEVRDVSNCARCLYWRRRKRLSVQVHEDFLPIDDVKRQSIVFELAVPTYLSAYRNTTWKILRDLAHPTRQSSAPPQTRLHKCPQLQDSMTADSSCLSFASVKKCFTETHYSFNSGLVPLAKVLLPFAADFDLYDHSSKVWVADLNKHLTLQHLCGVHVPLGLCDTVLKPQSHPAPDVDGPSSHQIQANLTKYPPNMSAAEFSAYQKLLAGKARRWPNILVELGSSNLNFSSEDTTLVLSQLAVQAGPCLDKETGVLRSVHAVMGEQNFITNLGDQIEGRLTSIRNNWRETNCMELLINLSLRMFSLLPRNQARCQPQDILCAARAATLAWISQLQVESRKTQDGVAASRIAMYGLKAALLCRRTFEAHIESKAHFTSSELSAWVRASVALQENLTFGISGMPTVLKSMMIRDAKMACCLEDALHDAVQAHSAVLEEALGITGPSPARYQAPIHSPWTRIPDSQWIVCTKLEPFGRSQVFHLNILDGHFLVNGKPRGSLPLEMRNHPAVRSLFGNRNLFVYPSAIHNMSHQLADFVQDYAIHFGMRGSQIVIRAIAPTGDQFEFLCPEIFMKFGDHSFDLPASMIDNCFHWLNLKTRIVQVRRQPWTWQPQDWLIDLRNQCATRGGRDDVILVDPRSREFHQISKVFEHFETPRNLTVFQPRSPSGVLSVELHHLDLSFHVNKIGLLYSSELKASIDLNQDVGTWYGLASKIVLRAAADSERRSIILPIGDMTWNRNRHDVHVSVKLNSCHGYCRFDIDPIIGRISNPPERRLLFLKAMCHAATSFCLPDPLTGRTGTEEALRVLRSGAAQPWAPFAPTDLQKLASLLPRREYYPQDKKRLQRMAWDPSLTTTIQNDRFDEIIRSIETRISRLARFSSSETECVQSVGNFSQLRHRSQLRRQIYERPTQDTAHLTQIEYTYPARDKRSTPSGDRVYQIVKLLRAPEPRINMSGDLMRILETWDSIDGFREDCPSQSAQPLASQLSDSISSRWGSLVSMCRGAGDVSPWAFQLGSLALNLDIDMDLLVSFIGFCRIKQISQLEPPLHASFSRFKDRGPMSAETLQELISKAYIPAQNFKRSKAVVRADAERHQENCEEQGRQLAQLILAQWPHLPQDAGFTNRNWSLIDVDLALEYIEPEWDRRCQNDELCVYVTKVDAILREYQGPQVTERPHHPASSVLQFVGRGYDRTIPSVSQDLVTNSCSPLDPFNIELSAKAFEAKSSVGEHKKEQEELSNEIVELEGILTSFARSPDDLRHSYSQDLLGSLTAFKQSHRETRNGPTWPNPSAETIAGAMHRMQSVKTCYDNLIQAALWATESTCFKWLKMGDLLPCSTTVDLLELLQSKANHQFGPGMKSALIVYGCAIAELQRLRRLRTATLQDNKRGIEEELCNTGHENWDPVEENADWLLLEIDGNILIRPDQVDVARAIIDPASGENSVLQLNMGRGKTSCIMPMAAAVLADGNNVSRLIVPKPLIMQTAQMMHSRLGGLVGRDICHIPFSRQTPTTDDVLGAYSELHRDVQSSQGLILTSHEHVLSYRLSGLQRLADNKLSEAERMINFQKWLNLHCRDLLDESDFTLSPKTQLNYPSGAEIAVDGHPFRWQVAQGLLAMAAEVIPRLKAIFPGSIEVVPRSSWFPSVQFLKNDVEDELHRLIVEDIANGRAPFLRQDKAINEKTRIAIKRVLSEEAFDSSLFEKASKAFADPKTAAIKLLVVRGLIVHKIMAICLGKRWNVQYGLHPNRSPVAVPFAAKGVPSDLSEYGHPDVAIVLTCLSFYYAGLSYDQLRQGLQRVLTSEDAALEYERWISESTLPLALQSWNLINVDDEIQMQVLWRHLGKNRVVTNHFMNNFVFPIHARQFAVKLQASAWDVPLKSSKVIPGARTTGFSGTNDNRYMLPMTIKQEDLPGLLQTNAEVLSYLLQPRNRGYAVLTSRHGQRLSEYQMLRMLHKQGMQILIDAGAYILETGNRALARMWFSIDHKAQSAVYFRDDNRPWVVFRDPAKPDMPLLATRLADDLTGCFVYFDEAHTRGVDLKLPEKARAALTLALKQTKDNTMQAAMRLRQLGISQSLAFFAPPEVDISIKETCKKYDMGSAQQSIGSPEVIFWLLEQTCQANEDLRPLFLAQGRDFCRRENALLQYPQFLNSSIFRSKLLKLLQQSEHQTLAQLYGATSNRGSSQPHGPMKSRQLQKYADTLVGYEDTGLSLLEALGEVEQERQVEVQVEAVREVEKPVHYQPLKFSGLSKVILNFMRTGVLETSVSETIPALDYIGRTTVGKKFGICSRGTRLFVSREFCQTIVLPKADKSVGDRFLRPVEWILWSPSTQTALVIIPEEAELLIPRLRLDQDKAKIHLIAYSAPVIRAMVPFNQLRYYSLPAVSSDVVFPTWLKVELGILAGRLYTDYDEWKMTGDYIRGSEGNKPISLAFLIEWLGVRCRAHDILHTPLGYICLGREATEAHPFFVRNTAGGTPELTAVEPDDVVEQLKGVKLEAWT